MRLEFYSLDRNNGSQVGDNFMLFWLNDELSMRKAKQWKGLNCFPPPLIMCFPLKGSKSMEKKLKFMPSRYAVTKKVLFSLSFKVRLIARNPFVPYDSHHVSPVASKPNNSMVETLHASLHHLYVMSQNLFIKKKTLQ